MLLQDETSLSHLVFIVLTLHAKTHTQVLPGPTERDSGCKEGFTGAACLPAVGWLEGLAVFVKVMGPRWANSQGTRSTLCHLRRTLVEKEFASGGWGSWRRRFPAPPKIPSALLHLLQLHLKVITRPAVSKQASYGVSIVGLRLGAWGALLHLFGEERPEQTRLMKS